MFALGITRRRFVPLRYALDALRTAAYLILRRPRAVIVMHPPIVPSVLVWAYHATTGAPFVLDSHNSAFGFEGDTLSRRTLGLHAWLARRARCVLVTGDELASVVEGWGGHALPVHEAPPQWSVPPARPLPARPCVLVPGRMASDDPVSEVLTAARLLAEADVVVTGDRHRAPAGSLDGPPPNLSLPGFLPSERYVEAIAAADVVVSLSLDHFSVMRTAYEAVYAGRPLVISDWPALAEVFPHAVRVANTADEIARGVREALRRHDELRATAGDARALALERWQRQRDAVAAALDL